LKISELPTGQCSVILAFTNGEKRRVSGKITEKRGIKYLIARQSPKKSFGPGTQVLWNRNETKKGGTK